MTSDVDYDVIVVGAGVSGLYAAYALQKDHGKKVLVLEAKDRVGGRTYSKPLKCAGGEDVWDLGGQWVGSSQHHIMGLLNEFGLKVNQQYDDGRSMLMLHTWSRPKSFSGSFPSLGPLKLLDLALVFRKIESMAATIDPDNVTAHPNAMEWDSMTMHTFLNQNCRFQETRDVIEALLKALSCVELGQMSLLFFLHSAKQAGSTEAALGGGKDSGQEWTVEGSMGQICDILADKVKRSNILLEHPVVSLTQAEDSLVEVSTVGGETFRAERVIFSIPPHLVNAVRFNPELPFDRVKLGEEMPQGHVIKFIITYETCFWREKGLSGMTFFTEKPCSTGPVSATLDATSSKGNPALVGFICAEHATYWSRRTMSERREAVLHALAKVLGDESLSPIHYEDKDWSREPYNGGCPGAIMRPRAMLYYYHVLTKPFGRVHWAGTESASAHSGYVEGALESAKRAVSEVVNGPPPSFQVWEASPAFVNYKSYASELSPSWPRRLCRALKWVVAIGVVAAAITLAAVYSRN